MSSSQELTSEAALEAALQTGAAQFRFRPENVTLIRGLSSVLIGLSIVIAVWWILAETMSYVRGAAFPMPIETFEALYDAILGQNINGETIYVHTQSSLLRWISGYVIATILGLIAGCILGANERVYDIGMVPVYVLQMIPGLAWIPIAMLIFGLGEVSTIFIIAVTALPPIIINTSGGIRQVPRIYRRVAEMSGMGGLDVFRKVLLPASLLDIINGLRIGLANGWRVLIAAEMVVGVATGLGYSIFQARYSLDFVSSFVCIMVICLIGLTIEKVLFVGLENNVRNRLGLGGSS